MPLSFKKAFPLGRTHRTDHDPDHLGDIDTLATAGFLIGFEEAFPPWDLSTPDAGGPYRLKHHRDCQRSKRFTQRRDHELDHPDHVLVLM